MVAPKREIGEVGVRKTTREMKMMRIRLRVLAIAWEMTCDGRGRGKEGVLCCVLFIVCCV